MKVHWLIWPFKFIFALGLESSAHRLMEAHQWQEAVGIYGRLIQWSPEQATFHTESGLAHLMLGERETAEERFREAIRLSPTAFRAYDLLGVLLSNEGRYEEAEEVWERSIRAGQELAARRPLLYGRYVFIQIQEARERLEKIASSDFKGFPLDPGYNEYPGQLPGGVDTPPPRNRPDNSL